jgi:hypothetical protein
LFCLFSEIRFGVVGRVHVALLFAADGPSQTLQDISRGTKVTNAFWSFVHSLGLEDADLMEGNEGDGWFRGDEAVEGRYLLSWRNFQFCFYVVPLMKSEQRKRVFAQTPVAVVFQVQVFFGGKQFQFIFCF